MFDVLLTAAYAPFAVAFVVMLGIGLIEAIGLSAGDGDAGVDQGDTGVLDWLGFGEGLPLLLALTSLLACFTFAGLVVQQGSTAVTGAPLHWALASVAALAVAAVANRWVVRRVARVFPGIETSVISTDDLIMRRGTILEGTARRGVPARAKVVDQHSQAHFILVEPQYDEDTIPAGATALLVARRGTVFLGIPDVDTRLTAL